MRLFDIEALNIETAGQTTPGSLLQLAGIKDGRKFRDAVLKQRDLVVGSEEDRNLVSTGPSLAPSADTQTDALLQDIRDTLRRIEHKLPASTR
jgi:putative membrane protein